MAEGLARVLGAAAAAALLLWPGAVRADDSAPLQDRAVTENAPRGGPPLVVIADIGGTATGSAELRAALYQVARAHGYEPASKVDVEGVASHETLMQSGTVTDDPKGLQRLRAALGVDVVVRVGKTVDREGAVARITVVTVQGFQTRLLPSVDTEAVRHALDVLLPRQDGTARANSELGPGEHTPIVDPSTHQLWEARSGLRATYGAMAFASVTSLRHVGFRSAGPDGTTVVDGSGTATGVGGGVGARVGLIFWPTLEPSPTKGSFFAFRAGLGLDVDFLYVRTPKRYEYSGSSRTTVYGNEALWLGSIPLEIGGAFAVGHFGETSWHGALIGIAYAPQGQFSMDLSGTTGHFRLNPAGAELTVDIAGIDASRGDESATQIRLAVWGLAPLDDAHPGLLSLGIGAIWY